MGLDGRIGRKFLHPGPGYGGSCFPKDTLALVRTAQEAGAPIRIVEAVVDINTDRKKAMASRIIDACGGDVAGKTIAILGLTFKPNTDDMRESPSLDIVPALQAAGASVRAFDPEGMEEAKKVLDGVTWCEDTYDAIKGSDADWAAALGSGSAPPKHVSVKSPGGSDALAAGKAGKKKARADGDHGGRSAKKRK